jgi:hypothetical protein
MKRTQSVGQGSQSINVRDQIQPNRNCVSIYRVGELYHPGLYSWPAGAQLSYSSSGLNLTLLHDDIREDVITAIHRGRAEFALIVDRPVIVFAYRFGDAIGWNDIPYSWHLQPDSRRAVPSSNQSSETRILLWVSLVGTDDGIIHAQRGVTLSPAFTSAIHHAIRDQAMMSLDPQECTSALSRIYLDHSDTVDRLPLAVARTMGNE